MHRYVIVGMGAVGGTIAARLTQGGVPCIWVARGEHARVLSERGLTLHTPHEVVEVTAPVWTGPDEAELTPDDVIVLATKTQQAQDALAQWADAPVRRDGAIVGTAGSMLPILLCTNGVAAEELALRYFARVYGVCVWAPCQFLEPGVIRAQFAPASAMLHLSRVPAALTDDADRAFLSDLERSWSGAHLQIELPDDVLPWKYRKLISNATNILNALLGDGEFGSLAQRLDAECREVLAAAQVEVTPDDEEKAARRAGPRWLDVPGGGPGGSSTWQSLTKGQSLETDYLNGEFVRLAHAAGRHAPINEALARLGRQAARDGLRPGDLTIEDIEAHLP